MEANPGLWMYDTLEECCKARFEYDYDNCVDYEPDEEEDTGSDKFYIDWKSSGQKCVQDCKTGGECGGLAASWDVLYDDKKKCCAAQSWKPAKDCLAE
jgi:hypothetical protein